ncbi:hypothetical protein IJH10_00595 [Candidatus Saccharibacteria bacterium]|nr:hypothetical protein [Candidatus Saccharibacteria bacterium]MBR0416156.1 hypothetical protein [Candidatus Saccharibacteria bacterium]
MKNSDSSSTSSSFDLKRAYHAMQVARQNMLDAQQKMQDGQRRAAEIYNEIGDMQAQHDKLKEAKDSEWDTFSEEITKAKAKIGDIIEAINACNTQEESFKRLETETEHVETKAIYDKAARFFSKLAAEKMLERDDLIAKKRQMVSPDMSMLKEMREKLKNLRAEQDDILEAYHEAKNEFNLKKASYDRARAKYEGAKNPDTKQDVDDFSSRPKAMELDKDLLKLAEVPEENWDSSKMERRVDGKVDIYYGGKSGVRHGHAVIAKNNTVEYSRKPRKTPTIILK